jgi:hypothetical protein
MERLGIGGAHRQEGGGKQGRRQQDTVLHG